MRRSRALLAPIAVVAASMLLLPGTALSQADSASSQAEGAGTEAQADGADEDPYAFDDEDDYEYVDIDSYGSEATGEAAQSGEASAGAAASATAVTSGAAADSAPEAADVPEDRSVADHAARVGEVSMDLLVLRPFGAAATAVGYGFLLVSSPFVIISNDWDSAREVFVADRARYTFERPLGQF